MATWISPTWNGVIKSGGLAVVEFNHLGFCLEDCNKFEYKEEFDVWNIIRIDLV